MVRNVILAFVFSFVFAAHPLRASSGRVDVWTTPQPFDAGWFAPTFYGAPEWNGQNTANAVAALNRELFSLTSQYLNGATPYFYLENGQFNYMLIKYNPSEVGDLGVDPLKAKLIGRYHYAGNPAEYKLYALRFADGSFNGIDQVPTLSGKLYIQKKSYFPSVE